jgi:hypothetical protein
VKVYAPSMAHGGAGGGEGGREGGGDGEGGGGEGGGGEGEGEGEGGVVHETYKKGAPAVAGKLAHPPQPPPLKRTTEAPTHPLGQALGGWVPVKVAEVVTELDKVPPLQVKEYCIIQPPG